ncbi:MAG TPA: aldo/keto reductase [Acidobacteriaceae bacterium]|nr:aldo/keto reductase [Acidobacteriaceae bacterium]
MEYVNLGSTGVKVSRICLGCMSYGVPPKGELRPGSQAWSLDEEQSAAFFKQALDAGINFFDTANVYATGDSERVLGRWLKGNARREDTVIATKLNGVMRDGPNGGGLSRKEIFFELDESLKRLGTDYVDLYQIHRWDKTTPIEETLEALNDCVRAGKVRYIGASTMWAWQFSKALYTSAKHGWAKFVTMQPHYNLLYREEEREMLPLCADQGVGVIPWSPLARGKLARPWGEQGTARSGTDPFGKGLYSRTGDIDEGVVRRLGEVAAARGVSQAQVALAWLMTKAVVTAPIVGATKLHHLEDAVAAVDLKLTTDEVKALEEPYVVHPVLGLS